MHTLIIEENKVLRESMATTLQKADHRVTLASGQAAVLAVLEREAPDAIVIGWNGGAGDIIRRIRSQEVDAHAFVVALLDKHPVTVIPSLFAAGADDFARAPLCREELLARLAAPERFRKWASIAAKLAAQELTGERDLLQLNVFTKMGEFVAADLVTLLGPMDIAEGFLVSGDLYGASIPMSIATERAEIRVSIVIEKRLVRTLAGILLCDEDAPEPAIKDMIREIANTAGGSVKRAGELDKLSITTGLPVDEPRGVTKSEMTRCWTVTIHGSEAQIGIVGEVNRRSNQRLPLTKVSEGMVIVNDIRTETGALIVPSGTRLSMATVTRLVGLLGQRFVVDVLQA
jgi:CheY-like chemotaxis protein